MEAQVQSCASPCGIYGGQSDTIRTGLSQSNLVWLSVSFASGLHAFIHPLHMLPRLSDQ